MRKNKGRQSKNSNILITVVIVLFVIFLCVFFRIQTMRIAAQNAEEEKKIAALQDELDAEKARTDEIDEYEKYVNTKQFIEDIARQRLGLIYPDEIIFKPEE